MPVIKKHNNFFDFVLVTAGTIAALFDVANANGMGITDEPAAGTSLTVPVVEYAREDVELKPSVEILIPQNEIKKFQSFFDFVTQHSGSLSAAFDVALLNGRSITSLIDPGTILKKTITDKQAVNYFINSGDDIISLVPYEKIVRGGIGYMQIQNTFIVS